MKYSALLALALFATACAPMNGKTASRSETVTAKVEGVHKDRMTLQTKDEYVFVALDDYRGDLRNHAKKGDTVTLMRQKGSDDFDDLRFADGTELGIN